MVSLTFAEQVKIVLKRKGMTIKELAEIMEKETGKKMSRQNLTQRLGRDNFQEQDMRLIAEILGCPFQLSILADVHEVERAANISDVQPTEEELSKLARAKGRKEERSKKKEVKQEQKATEEEKKARIKATEALKKEESVQDELLGETVAEAVMPEETVLEAQTAMPEEAVSEAQVAEPEEIPVEELLADINELESEQAEKGSAPEAETARQEERKVHGWRAMFQRRPRKEGFSLTEEDIANMTVADVRAYAEAKRAAEENAGEAAEYEEPAYDDYAEYYDENDYIDYESIEEPEIEEEEIPEEPQAVGEINPYTGMEYESNSVRMHPKRIGYVQVYDRSDHQWTDMTEWAFLGYQERKKALLGKDYEPPIYLD